jgi:hypothetical protein
MLKFANLTLSQQKCVVALLEADASLKKTGQITLKQVVAITQELAEKRTAGGVKIGYPNWLFKANKIEKGVYQLPVPTDAELSKYTQDTQAKANPVKTAKAKVAKLAKAKVVKVKQAKVQKSSETDDEFEPKVSSGRLAAIIDESVAYDEDVEDFNAILRENGITI